MGRGNLLPEEIQILKENPNVLDVIGSRIIYTNEFKVHFMEAYQSGQRPTQIFRDAGFDVKVLGSKRIERATANWKESFHNYMLGTSVDRQYQSERKKAAREEENQVKIVELTQEIERLKRQVSMLSTALGVE